MDQDSSDPVFIHSVKEAKELIIAFLVFMIWSVGVSYFLGYNPGPEIKTVFGIPMWVFWGIAVPWGTANLYTIFFCFRRMANDQLIESQDEPIPSSDQLQQEVDA